MEDTVTLDQLAAEHRWILTDLYKQPAKGYKHPWYEKPHETEKGAFRHMVDQRNISVTSNTPHTWMTLAEVMSIIDGDDDDSIANDSKFKHCLPAYVHSEKGDLQHPVIFLDIDLKTEETRELREEVVARMIDRFPVYRSKSGEGRHVLMLGDFGESDKWKFLEQFRLDGLTGNTFKRRRDAEIEGGHPIIEFWTWTGNGRYRILGEQMNDIQEIPNVSYEEFQFLTGIMPPHDPKGRSNLASGEGEDKFCNSKVLSNMFIEDKSNDLDFLLDEVGIYDRRNVLHMLDKGPSSILREVFDEELENVEHVGSTTQMVRMALAHRNVDGYSSSTSEPLIDNELNRIVRNEDGEIDPVVRLRGGIFSIKQNDYLPADDARMRHILNTIPVVPVKPSDTPHWAVDKLIETYGETWKTMIWSAMNPRAKKIFLMIGEADRGKSSLFQALAALSIAMVTDQRTTNPDMFVNSGSSRFSNLFPMLASHTLVLIDDVPTPGSIAKCPEFATDRIKGLTGADVMTFEIKGGAVRTVPRLGSLWITANHPPLINTTDEVVYDRLHVVGAPSATDVFNDYTRDSFLDMIKSRKAQSYLLYRFFHDMIELGDMKAPPPQNDLMRIQIANVWDENKSKKGKKDADDALKDAVKVDGDWMKARLDNLKN